MSLLEINGDSRRALRQETMEADLVITGGGLAGTCCAITAARQGLSVILVQDRPVLGGNASSEIRLWALGATSHMGNNNRWAREGGVIDEILIENLYRNREGNPVLFDTILLEKVYEEKRIRLLLNTAVFSVENAGDAAGRIASVRAFNSQNSTLYTLKAPFFCDASGDGIVGYLAGAAFRMGAESRDEFDERFAPDEAYGRLLGHSLFMYTKDTGAPVRFVAPSYADKEIESIRPYRTFDAKTQGCQLWWVEYGGRKDTIHETEAIKWKLWSVIYGIWDYIKNSGQFPEAANRTLEWVGMIPGKRESRRFEGDYMLTQRDVVEQRRHADAVSYGGWALDLHPADGVHSDRNACDQWHSKGVYQIPWRCLYSRTVDNLFLAGRIISASHVAFGSTRVMMTCAHSAQAVAVGAALCRAQECAPRDLLAPQHMEVFQRKLIRTGQAIPHVESKDPENLVHQATIEASSSLQLAELPPGEDWLPLNHPWAMLLPAPAGPLPLFRFRYAAPMAGALDVELRVSSRLGNYTPDRILEKRTLDVAAGEDLPLDVIFETAIEAPQYVFVCLMACPGVRLRLSSQRLTGVLAVTNQSVRAVARNSTQEPPEGKGLDPFEFWRPVRRPAGQNLAMSLSRPLDLFGPENVRSETTRPTTAPNAWVADGADPNPSLTLRWEVPQSIARIELSFDPDWDHPLESVLMGHPEDASPFCVKGYRIEDGAGRILAECADNHQARNGIDLEPPVTTDTVTVRITETRQAPAALFNIRCYEKVVHIQQNGHNK